VAEAPEGEPQGRSDLTMARLSRWMEMVRKVRSQVHPSDGDEGEWMDRVEGVDAAAFADVEE
jgi:hypothetical protein